MSVCNPLTSKFRILGIRNFQKICSYLFTGQVAEKTTFLWTLAGVTEDNLQCGGENRPLLIVETQTQELMGIIGQLTLEHHSSVQTTKKASIDLKDMFRTM